ncbi:27 kDa antigen Cfp30B [Corynebacterium ciconiae DSM 44920]|uniref:VOC family protein n=1 Tax=Corynebacterium ciconiae TaxID=227319 RepID=UPI0003671724|nr:VOC family protein [Corynebacterium ciconiae]WKD60127.1 27 kDa antigen Cfp30B [Corynebacterium ciconiae DSM 44920]
MPAFMGQDGMPYWIDLSTSELRKARYFYSKVCGWEYTELASGYLLATKNGMPVAGLVAKPEDSQQPDSWVTYFLAEDIDQVVARVPELGGRCLTEPLPTSQGRMAVIADSSGALCGVIQPQGEERFVAAGEPGTSVWHELTTVTNHEETLHFYAELFGWDLHTVESDAGQSYTMALAEGAAFAGFYDAAGQFPPQVPSFWQSFLGVEDLRLAVQLVEDLGGEIIRPPMNSDFGALALVADSTGAVVTLVEVDEPREEEFLDEAAPLHDVDVEQLRKDMQN